MDWRRSSRYAAAILAMQILIGFLNGLLFVPTTQTQEMASVLGGAIASILICGAIFTHFAIRQRMRLWQHASVTLVLYLVFDFALDLALTLLLSPIHPTLSLLFSPTQPMLQALWLLESSAACLLGTLLGQRVASRRTYAN